MSVRGRALRDAIRAVIDTFGADSDAFVFVGACVLGLYARARRALPSARRRTSIASRRCCRG